jgi:putative redox protein
MNQVTVKTLQGKFQQTVTIGKHSFIADEPAAEGGDDAGPEPHELLLASLGTCTAMTIQFYVARKSWVLRSVEVTLSGEKKDDAYYITRTISLDGDLDADQKQKILEIANKCPVHKTLSNPIKINTVASSQ